MDMRRLFTHNWSKLFRRDIFGGIGPSSPLACISLQEFKFEWEYTLNLDLSTIKTQRTWDIFKRTKISQSCQLFPILYEIRYNSSEFVIIYPTVLSNKMIFDQAQVDIYAWKANINRGGYLWFKERQIYKKRWI